MSNNVLNGFEDQISRYNLATNGSFIINQRGNFASLTPVAVNDYLADAWYVISNSVDYVEAQTAAPASNGGWIRIKGHGKKGQYLELRCKDKEPYGIQGSIIFDVSQGRALITGSVVIQPLSTHTIPVQVSVYPRNQSTGDETLYEKNAIIPSAMASGQGPFHRAIRVLKTTLWNPNVGGRINISINGDGEFDFYVRGFMELCGGFRNPPTDAFVPYGEELQRCERYLQYGQIREHSPLRSTGSAMEAWIGTYFRTKMAGTPTITFPSIDLVNLFQDASDGNGTTASDQANWTVSAQYIYDGGFNAKHSRSSVIASRDAGYFNTQWAAEIA